MRKCKACGAAMEVGDRFCGECGADQNSGLEAMMTVGALETLDDNQTRVSMGVVYRAHDKLAEKDVALKLIRADRLSGPAAMRRLISEGITARDIRHTNIVAVYDVGEADGQPFVSMEYLKGQSLRDWHREKIRQREDVPLRVAARIMAEVLDGLAAAHEAGVIHRDLSPENIMLVGEPTEQAAPLKILDFGIARAVGAGLESGTGTGLGKPRYMAPEQVTNPDTAGPPADLYSLSIVFYELLVDVLPQGHWQPPSGGRSDVPPGIDALIERGLSNRPANRPQTAPEYRKALIDAVNLRAVPGPVPRPGPGPIPPKVPINRSLLKWGGIGLGTLILIGALGSLFEDDPPSSQLSTDTVIERGGTQASRNDFRLDGRQTQTPISTLNGYWIDDTGVRYTMRVTNDGAFSGSGTNIYGVPVQLSGQFNGASANMTVTVPTAGMAFNGRLQWDRECHVSYQVFDHMNNLTDQGRFHVNHPPDAPCP